MSDLMLTGLLAWYITELEEDRSERPRHRLLRDAQNPLALEENQFQNQFRISKSMANYLVHRLTSKLQRRRSNGLSVQSQVLTAVRFYVTGSYQRGVGCEYDLAVSQSSVSRCVSQVSQAIHDVLVREWVKFPITRQERSAAKQKFANASQPFPGAIGAISCTHIAIIAPSVHEEACRNNRGYHSLNVQMICDPDKVILNVNPKYPGARHDSFIWANSSAKRVMELWHARGEKETWVIGDSEYSLEPWLMTPIVNSDDPHLQMYSDAHCKAHSVVKHCFGVLKATFRCLSKQRVLMYSPAKAGLIINSCAVLHNMRIKNNLEEIKVELPAEDSEQFVPVDDDEIDIPEPHIIAEGKHVQQQLIAEHFH